MTAPPQADPPVVLELPESGSGERAARRRRTQQRRLLRRIGFVTAMVVLVGAIPVLGTIGLRELRDTTTGRRIDAQNDPSKPRYEANVVPTPVALVAETAADGSLTGITILALGPNDRGGAVVFVPLATVAPKIDGTLDTLQNTMRTDNLSGLTQAAANLVGISFDESLLIGPTPLEQFVTPVAPLTVQNPDRVVQTDSRGRSTTLFAAGPVTLPAEQVAAYLTARNPNESDLAHLARKGALWTAWLAAIKASTNPNAVPGETNQGLGRYLLALSKGNVEITTLPVKPQPPPNASGESFVADHDAVAALIARAVPLPTPANPGDKMRVRLLSGTGPIGSPNAVVSKIVAAGGEITIVGNADRFDYATTQIIYYDDQFAAGATKLQAALGLGQVTKSSTATDTEDVTVILGKDATAAFGGSGG